MRFHETGLGFTLENSTFYMQDGMREVVFASEILRSYKVMMPSLDSIRAAANEIWRKSGIRPPLESVAELLMVDTEACRAVIREARAQEKISLASLGLSGKRLTQKRQMLAESLEPLTHSRVKIFVISRLLHHNRAGNLSTEKTRVLVYACLTGQYLYEKLDVPYAKIVHALPHRISDLLHDSSIKSRSIPGLLTRLEDLILAGARTVPEKGSRQYVYREFLANLTVLNRGVAEGSLLRAFLDHGSGNVEAARILAPHIDRILSARWQKTLTVAPTHGKLIRSMVRAKSEGTFTTLAVFAEENDLDVSGIYNAFKARGEYPGLADRLVAGARILDLPDQALLNQALAALRRAKRISVAEATAILTALSEVEKAQIGLTETQRIAIRLRFDCVVSGSQCSTKELASLAGVTPDSFLQALRARPGQLDPFGWVDDQLAKMPLEERKKLIQSLIPFSDDKWQRNFLTAIATIVPKNQLLERRRDAVVDALESFVHVLNPTPVLKIVSGQGTRKEEWLLRPHEIAKLLTAYLTECRGDLTQLASRVGEILGIRGDVRVSSKALRTLMSGRSQPARVRGGAIAQFQEVVASIQDVLCTLANSNVVTVPYDDDPVRDSLYGSVLQWATRIVEAPNEAESIRITGLFCATRAHTIREIARVAERLAERAGDTASREFFGLLYVNTSTSSLQISDAGIAEQFAQALSSCYDKKLNIEGPIVRFLISSCSQRGVSSAAAAQLLIHLHSSAERMMTKAIVEEWSVASYKNGADSEPAKCARFARLAYERFLERVFGPHLTRDELRQNHRCYSSLVELAIQHQYDREKLSTKMREHLEGFYARYSIERVVNGYCRHLVRTESNPLGVPYFDLYESAVSSVNDAAAKYDPERYAREGRPLPSFATYAIHRIRWDAARLRKQEELVHAHESISLDQPISGDFDGENTYHALIASGPEAEAPDAYLSNEAMSAALNSLSAIPRRIVELRFRLGEEENFEGFRSLRSIARLLHREGVTPHVFSPEAIGQSLARAMVRVRSSMWSGSLGEWQAFFESPDQRETPGPLMMKVTKGRVELTEGISFVFGGENIRKRVVLEIERVLTGGKTEREIFVRARDVEDLRGIGLFLVTLARQKVLGSERLE